MKQKLRLQPKSDNIPSTQDLTVVGEADGLLMRNKGEFLGFGQGEHYSMPIRGKHYLVFINFKPVSNFDDQKQSFCGAFFFCNNSSKSS